MRIRVCHYRSGRLRAIFFCAHIKTAKQSDRYANAHANQERKVQGNAYEWWKTMQTAEAPKCAADLLQPPTDHQSLKTKSRQRQRKSMQTISVKILLTRLGTCSYSGCTLCLSARLRHRSLQNHGSSRASEYQSIRKRKKKTTDPYIIAQSQLRGSACGTCDWAGV